MPSLLGHAVAGLAITSVLHRDKLPRRTWGLAALCAVAPDVDWFVSLLHLHRGHVLNHRGVTHSLFAALVLAGVVYFAGFRKDQRRGSVWLCLAVAALSHGLLDACTAGGVGVALFMPFSETRWACIWQPCWVAPLPVGREHVFSFLWSLWSEAFWIGVPALALAGYSRLVRQAQGPSSLDEAPAEGGY